MAIKNGLRDRITGYISGAGLAAVKGDLVPAGKIYCYQRIAWEIDKATSGGNTRCRLYIDGRGYNHYLSEQDGPTAAALYWDADPVWLHPGEKLALEVDQAQATTTVQIYATGYFVDFGEGVI